MMSEPALFDEDMMVITALLYSDKIKPAKEIILSYLPLMPKNTLLLDKLVHCHFMEKNFSEAIIVLHKLIFILEEGEEMERAVVNLAKAFRLNGDVDKALKILQAMFSEQENKFADSEIGICYTEKGDLNTARKYIEESLKRENPEPLPYSILSNAADFFSETGEFDVAELILLELIKQNPIKSCVMCHLAEVSIELGKKSRALRLAMRLRDFFPDTEWEESGNDLLEEISEMSEEKKPMYGREVIEKFTVDKLRPPYVGEYCVYFIEDDKAYRQEECFSFEEAMDKISGDYAVYVVDYSGRIITQLSKTQSEYHYWQRRCESSQLGCEAN